MSEILLLAVPFTAAIIAVILPNSLAAWRRAILPVAAAAHAGLTAVNWTPVRLNGILIPELGIDSLGLVFLSLTSGLFLLVALYSLGDLKRYAARGEAAGSSERV